MKLIKLFKDFLKEGSHQPPYIVEDVSTEKCGLYVHYRLRGKSNTIKQKLEEILLDDNSINMFDQKTIRTLTYLLLRDSLSPKMSIQAQKLNENADSHIMKIKSEGSNLTQEITASDLSQNKEMIEKLTSKEAHRIGYLVGYKEGFDEAKQIMKRKVTRDQAST